MAEKDDRTARYECISSAGENRYRFFCEVSGVVVHTTGPVRGDTEEEELRLAWEHDGRQHFNRCQKCGKWVSDVMYNADTGQCVLCSPWEEPPDYCPSCGAAVPPADRYCRRCGEKLQYREVAAND